MQLCGCKYIRNLWVAQIYFLGQGFRFGIRRGIGWDVEFEVLEFFDGGERLIFAVPGEGAIGAVEETFLTLDVLVERFEIGSVGAIGECAKDDRGQ